MLFYDYISISMQVRFYRNGDSYFGGHQVAVTKKDFPSIESLLVYLGGKINTTLGVRYIFRVRDGKEIRDIADIQGEELYVVSSTKKYIKIDYMYIAKDKYWKNEGLVGGKMRREEKKLYIQRDRRSQSYPGSSQHERNGRYNSKPAMGRWSVTDGGHNRSGSNFNSQRQPTARVITIVSNTHRDSEGKVLLNIGTTQTYEDILKDVGQMVTLDKPPVVALYVAHEPYTKV